MSMGTWDLVPVLLLQLVAVLSEPVPRQGWLGSVCAEKRLFHVL